MRHDGRDDAISEVARALTFLGWTLDVAEFRRCRRSLTAIVAVVCGMSVWFFVPSPGSALVVGAISAGTVWVGVRRVVLGLARLRRTRALGSAGTLLGLVVLRMRVEPTVETAVDFAATAEDGTLPRSLAAHARRGRLEGRSGLTSFATEWRSWFPAVERAAALVVNATDTEASDETLERALTAVRRGTRDELADFVGEIRGPVSGVYAFGVLLPLALVGLLPAARVAGLGVSVAAVAAVYDVVLPLLLLAASAWLLVRRPVAFPPPRVGRSHPDVSDRRPHALVGGAAVACAAWLLAERLVAPWASPVAATGFGLGTALVVVATERKRVRDRMRAVESELSDALATVGRRVVEGEAPETAFSEAGTTLSGAAGERLSAAGARMERTGDGPRQALLGPHGVFGDLRSRRIESAASMLALTATEGAPAGRALVSMAEQFEAFADIEAEARRELGRVTDTLANTATAFGPLVAGATVALAARVATEGSGTLGGSLSVPALGLAVGGYVLVSAVVLVGLSTALLRGLDSALLAYRVGLALPTATATYLASVVGARLLVGA